MQVGVRVHPSCPSVRVCACADVLGELALLEDMRARGHPLGDAGHALQNMEEEQKEKGKRTGEKERVRNGAKGMVCGVLRCALHGGKR